MKKTFLFFISILLLAGCSPELSIRTVEFAAMENNTLLSHSNSYSVGEIVYLVLEDVGSFEKDDNGKIKVDIDMTVIDFNNTILLNKTNMLGESGYLNVTGDYLEFPYVNVKTETLVAGNYDIFVTVRDLVVNKSATQSARFTLQ